MNDAKKNELNVTRTEIVARAFIDRTTIQLGLCNLHLKAIFQDARVNTINIDNIYMENML